MLAFDFMDSSCFKAFVTWVSSVRELDPASHYRMVFVSNAKKHWQAILRSLALLRHRARHDSERSVGTAI